MNKPDDQLPVRLRKLRKLLPEHGDMRKLAGALSTSQSRITNWFKLAYKPKDEDWVLIARYFQIPLEYFYDDAMTEPPRAGEGTIDPARLARDDDEQLILKLARELGADEAKRRLTNNIVGTVEALQQIIRGMEVRPLSPPPAQPAPGELPPRENGDDERKKKRRPG